MIIQHTRHMRAGFDCRFAPCQHPQKGDHGIHGDEIVLVATATPPGNRQVALALTVHTGNYPATIPAGWLDAKDLAQRPVSLTLCRKLDPKDAAGRDNHRCDYLVHCEEILSAAYLEAEMLWTRLPEADRNALEPSARLWGALDTYLTRHLTNPRYFAQVGEPAILTAARERFEALKAERALFEKHCQEVAATFERELTAFLATKS